MDVNSEPVTLPPVLSHQKMYILLAGCSPGPCCQLTTYEIPRKAWHIPFRKNPEEKVAMPRGKDTYPSQASLVVNLERCFPLAVEHSRGCTEIAFGGLHLLRCIEGYFRHAMFYKTEITGVKCGSCWWFFWQKKLTHRWNLDFFFANLYPSCGVSYWFVVYSSFFCAQEQYEVNTFFIWFFFQHSQNTYILKTISWEIFLFLQYHFVSLFFE